MTKPAYIGTLIGEPSQVKAKKKPWSFRENFLPREEADRLYAEMITQSWQASTYGDTAASSIYYGLSFKKDDDGRGGGRAGEIPLEHCPRVLAQVAEKVSKEIEAPYNYIQCHRSSPAWTVHPHFDPGDMIVPMLCIGQERTFRVGGVDPECLRGNPQFVKEQGNRKLSKHIPQESILMKHGSLLVFTGGLVIHSMYPAYEDSDSNLEGWDYRISLLFRYTVPAMRKHGPMGAKTVQGRLMRKQYKAVIAEWREEHGITE